MRTGTDRKERRRSFGLTATAAEKQFFKPPASAELPTKPLHNAKATHKIKQGVGRVLAALEAAEAGLPVARPTIRAAVLAPLGA